MFNALRRRNDFISFLNSYKSRGLYYAMFFLFLGHVCDANNLIFLELMKLNGDINDIEGNIIKNLNITLLGVCCHKGKLEFVKELLKIKGIDVNKGYFSPLYAAIEGHNNDIVIELLKRKDIKVNGGKYGDKYLNLEPINAACRFNNLKALKILLTKTELEINKFSFCSHINTRNNLKNKYERHTGLYHAYLNNNISIVKELLSHKNIDVNEGGRILTSKVCPLYACCVNGNEVLVNILLSRKYIKVNYGEREYLPIIAALKGKHDKIVNILLQRKDIKITDAVLYAYCMYANVNALRAIIRRKDVQMKINIKFFNPLHGACENGNLEVVKFLLKLSKINVNFKTKKDKTGLVYESAIYLAVKNGHLEVVKELLNVKNIDIVKVKACHNAPVSPYHVPNKYIEFKSLLYEACNGGYFNIVKELLKRKKININEGCVMKMIQKKKSYARRNYRSGSKGPNTTPVDITPLCSAVKNGFIEIALELLKREEINAFRGTNNVLIEACRRGFYAVVLELLKRKDVDVNINKGKRVTALSEACRGGNLKIVIELLKNKKIDVNGKALKEACKGGHLKIVLELLKRKELDVNKCGNNSALSQSSEKGHFEIVVELLKHDKIDVNKGRLNPLYMACHGGHLQIVKELLKRKDIEINKKSNEKTPLFVACNCGHLSIVKELLKRSDIDMHSLSTVLYKNEVTPLYICAKIGKIEIFKELLKKNIDVNKQCVSKTKLLDLLKNFLQCQLSLST